VRTLLGHQDPVPFDPEHAKDVAQAGGTLTLFVLLRGFSSGAVALTGVEAISDGVPAFKRPESKNAATTLTWMVTILGTLFLGVSFLAHHLQPYPSESETVISQMGRAVFHGGVFYWVLQLSTCLILALAANTAYADFPRLSSIIAADGFLPRQFVKRGDRLVFSNGVLFLACAASVLIIIFGGITTALIPLYAIGVFTSFTLSQSGMVRRTTRLREPGWRHRAAISGTGATATCIVALIVATTKFTKGAWVPIVVVPMIIVLFKAIHRHYRDVNRAITVTPLDMPPLPSRHTFVVLVGNMHRGVLEAIAYAKSLRPEHLTALHISDDRSDHDSIHAAWASFGFDFPLEIVDSPYRELVEPVERYLDDLDARWSSDRITVLIPEFVVGVKRLSNVLHGQSGLALKLALLERPNTMVISVPFHVRSDAERAEGAEPSSPLRAPLKQIDQERLVARFAADGHTPISDAPLRQRVTLRGEVTSVKIVPRAGSPSLEVTINDGSGVVNVVFLGRRRILGIDPGQAIEVEGVARAERGRVIVMNPKYELLTPA
jgi:hypothetical protein